MDDVTNGFVSTVMQAQYDFRSSVHLCEDIVQIRGRWDQGDASSDNETAHYSALAMLLQCFGLDSYPGLPMFFTKNRDGLVNYVM